jgi:hypothetical protein
MARDPFGAAIHPGGDMAPCTAGLNHRDGSPINAEAPTETLRRRSALHSAENGDDSVSTKHGPTGAVLMLIESIFGARAPGKIVGTIIVPRTIQLAHDATLRRAPCHASQTTRHR